VPSNWTLLPSPWLEHFVLPFELNLFFIGFSPKAGEDVYQTNPGSKLDKFYNQNFIIISINSASGSSRKNSTLPPTGAPHI
jgi:hypothetical protein